MLAAASAIAGMWNCITIYPLHVVSGIWMILAAFVLFLCEAPFCCQFLEFANKVSAHADKFKYWQKGALYCLLAIVPVIINAGLTSVLGNVITFATGVLYGLAALGKKGDGTSYAKLHHRQDIPMADTNDAPVPYLEDEHGL
uniref:calcium channel flower homolog isoform X2 n=1 Tax=Myxine glutinosa TaxID=7769 RepID=UPI00358FAF57